MPPRGGAAQSRMALRAMVHAFISKSLRQFGHTADSPVPTASQVIHPARTVVSSIFLPSGLSKQDSHPEPFPIESRSCQTSEVPRQSQGISIGLINIVFCQGKFINRFKKLQPDRPGNLDPLYFHKRGNNFSGGMRASVPLTKLFFSPGWNTESAGFGVPSTVNSAP